ncbi:hypothetical protein RRG08_052356 [Elysia crispata]|uniref:Uncharacterized protein n=1 Tax=Elysia crispata TaxID=231223 RepID=A0AAE1A6F8_9GAST|nr:hypothetical protein RRG08_052356 [Elysia crispata]
MSELTFEMTISHIHHPEKDQVKKRPQLTPACCNGDPDLGSGIQVTSTLYPPGRPWPQSIQGLALLGAHGRTHNHTHRCVHTAGQGEEEKEEEEKDGRGLEAGCTVCIYVISNAIYSFQPHSLLALPLLGLG